MKLSDLGGHGGEWLRGDGPEGDIVISSRVRLARNLAGRPFGTRATPAERRSIHDEVRARVMKSRFADRIFFVDLSAEESVEGDFLVERHLISRELAGGEGPRGVAFGSREAISIMVNEEDHLRIQVLQSGLQLEDAWRGAQAVDGLLEEAGLRFAFHGKYGYLTACPTNAGTGLRASVMLHLPALHSTEHLKRLLSAASEMGLAVRGLFGEGTEPLGHLYQVSNQRTLGRSEVEVVQSVVGKFVPQAVRYERMIREELVSRHRLRLEDQVWRSLGTLRHARLITSQETLEHLSAVRLGVNLGILQGIDLRTVNDLFILTQPAHMQKLEGRPLPVKERDEARAAFVRKRLAAAPG